MIIKEKLFKKVVLVIAFKEHEKNMYKIYLNIIKRRELRKWYKRFNLSSIMVNEIYSELCELLPYRQGIDMTKNNGLIKSIENDAKEKLNNLFMEPRERIASLTKTLLDNGYELYKLSAIDKKFLLISMDTLLIVKYGYRYPYMIINSNELSNIFNTCKKINSIGTKKIISAFK